MNQENSGLHHLGHNKDENLTDLDYGRPRWQDKVPCYSGVTMKVLDSDQSGYQFLLLVKDASKCKEKDHGRLKCDYVIRSTLKQCDFLKASHFSVLLKVKKLFIVVCVRARACALWCVIHACYPFEEGQKPTCKDHFSPCMIWILELELQNWQQVPLPFVSSFRESKLLWILLGIENRC